MKKKIQKFFFPAITFKFFIRAFLVALSAIMFFSFVLLPFKLRGHSMDPTYKDGQFNFCFKLKYLISEPQRSDVVAIRFAGNKILLLKRVIALPHETLEIKNGIVFIDGQKLEETYRVHPSNWNLSERKVKRNHVYVIGDNRNIPMENHHFGQTSINRIIGGPLW